MLAGASSRRSWVPSLLGGRQRRERDEAEDTLLLSEDQRVEKFRKGVQLAARDHLVIALAAKLAMADGPTNSEELAATRQIFLLQGVPEEKSEELFLEAARDPIRFEHYARRVVTLFPENPQMYRGVVGRLFQLAAADGPVNTDEIIYLKRVCDVFRLSPQFFLQKLRLYLLPPEGGNPYDVLGVRRNVSEELLKKTYYQAVRACHPDKLSFLDSAEEILQLATRRLTIISEAYSAIRQHRRAGKKTEAKVLA